MFLWLMRVICGWMNCFKWKRRRAEASKRANPHLLCGLCRSNDDEDADVLLEQQHTSYDTLDEDETNTNIYTPSTRDVDTAQHAEITVLDVHQIDRDNVPEADITASPETMEDKMARTVRNFQLAYLKAGADRFQVHEKYLEELGDLYMEKYQQEKERVESPSWKPLLKAFSLYNTAAVEFSEEDYWGQKASKPVSCLLGTTAKNIFLESVKKLHLKLKEIRTDTQCKLKSEPPNPEQMMDIISFSNGQMRDFAEMVVKESLKVVEEETPCDFSAVGLGSIGRGEATPYSDLEYLFLIKDEGCTAFFERLAVISYFLVGALRETSIHTLGISELSDWFLDKRREGFQIDGITETSGNVPTGGKESMPNSFIQTPESLLSIYASVLHNPDPIESKRGDLTAMLTFTTLLYTNQKGSHQSDEGLYQKFIDGKDRVNKDTNEKREEANVKMLESDLEKFRFFLDFTAHYSGYSLNLKKLLYRFPSLIFLDTSIMLKNYGEDSWETLKLWNQNRSQEDRVSSFAGQLHSLLLKGCYYRLQCYLAMDSRTDKYHIEPFADEKWISFVGGPSSDLLKPNRNVWTMAKPDFYELSTDSTNLQHYIRHQEHASLLHGTVELCANATLLASFFCCDWNAVVKGSQVKEEAEENISQPTQDSEMMLAKAFSLLYIEDYQRALPALMGYLKNTHNNNNKAIVTAFQGLARCHFKLGNLEDANNTYEDALALCDGKSSISKHDVGLAHFSFGAFLVKTKTEEYALALQELFKAMGLLIHDLAFRRADSLKLLEGFHRWSYKERLQYVSNPSMPLARCLYEIAGVFKKLDMTDLAKAYYNKAHSLGLMIVTNQREDDYTKIAISHELGKMFTRPEYIQRSLDILKTMDDQAMTAQLQYDALLSQGECFATESGMQVECNAIDFEDSNEAMNAHLCSPITALSCNEAMNDFPKPLQGLATEQVDSWFKETEAAAKRIGNNQNSSARIYQQRADIAASMKDFSKAQEYYKMSEDEYLNSGQRLEFAEVKQSLAKVHVQCEEYKPAEDCLNVAYVTLKDVLQGKQSQRRVARVQRDRAEVLKLLSRPDEAIQQEQGATELEMDIKKATAEDERKIRAINSHAIATSGPELPEDIEQDRFIIFGPRDTQDEVADEEDDDSDLSDGEGLLSPKEECDYEIRRKPQHTWKKRIKSLFNNRDKVYEMSKKTRGRALIINVERFNGPDALDLTRDGSSMDVKNMKFMLKQFGFELAPVKENPDVQEILDTIKKETQHKNHEDYNAFFLCIMTHGKENDQILGSDQRTVKLKDIYELLSPVNFPAMAGKPKIIVIQACAGSKRDLGKTGSKPDTLEAAEPQAEPDRSTRLNLDIEDLLILKSSFENYSSMRSEESGSLFIRSLVVTFNKHACHRDLYSLCEIVWHRVSTESKILAKKYPKSCFGQTAVPIKTFTRLRKVYLFPGYNPRAE